MTLVKFNVMLSSDIIFIAKNLVYRYCLLAGTALVGDIIIKMIITNKSTMQHNSPWEPPWALEELDIVGFMIDSGLKLSHEQHEPDWQNCSLEHFALISAN